MLQKLLKVKPNERPDATDLFSEKVVQMALENLSNANVINEAQSQDKKKILELTDEITSLRLVAEEYKMRLLSIEEEEKKSTDFEKERKILKDEIQKLNH